MKRKKVETVLQMEAVECGAASLAMILGYYGAHVPLEELRYECGVSRDGTKAGNILRAARTYGLTAKGFKKEPSQLAEMPLPAVLHWNFQHFLVLEGIDDEKAWLNDPALGQRTVTLEQLDEAFTGVVLTFEPNDAFKKRGAPMRVWPKLLERIQGSKSALVFAVVAGLLLAVPGIVIPLLARIFVDEILVGGKTSWLLPLLAFAALLLVLQSGLGRLRAKNLLDFRTKLSVLGSARFIWHTLRIEPRFFEARLPGDVAMRAGLESSLAGTLAGQLASTFIDLLLVVFYLIVMLSFDVPLTLAAVTAAAINIVALRMIQSHRATLSNRASRAESNLNGVQSAGLMQIETLKSTGSESQFFERWAGNYAHVVNTKQESTDSNLRLSLVPALLGGISTAVILCWGATRVLDGAMTMGTLVAFQALTASFLGPVQRVLGLWSTVQMLPGNLVRLDDVLKQRVVDPFGEGNDRTPLVGRVELEGVTFGYSPREPPLLDDFSLTVEPGQRVALVGSSGSGKSTIAKLIAGVYPPWAGTVLFDGRPPNTIDRRVFLDAFSVVNQEIILFEGTVRENLTFWDDSIPQEDVVRAAKDACIHEHIVGLPNGYDTKLEEAGRNLSGGQRQRLELARALVKNPALLVLDEATSALDSTVEQQIDRNLRRRGCTCLIVAHRLSTVRDADQIVVLERGKVVERGTHDDLYASDGTYRRLVASA